MPSPSSYVDPLAAIARLKLESEVVREGGFYEEDEVPPVLIPSRYLGGMSPLVVVVDWERVADWRKACQVVWQADGTVYFKNCDETALAEVRAYADQLVREGQLRAWYLDELQAEDLYPGIRGEYRGTADGSSQKLG